MYMCSQDMHGSGQLVRTGPIVRCPGKSWWCSILTLPPAPPPFCWGRNDLLPWRTEVSVAQDRSWKDKIQTALSPDDAFSFGNISGFTVVQLIGGKVLFFVHSKHPEISALSSNCS